MLAKIPNKKNAEKSEKYSLYVGILKNLLPHLGTDEGRIILAQVMITLKLEGILGKELNVTQKKMLEVLTESIISQPEKKSEALSLARELLK